MSAWIGGGGCADVGNGLHLSSSVHAPLLFVFVHNLTAYWGGSGRVSSSGDTEAETANSKAEQGRYV